MAGGRAMEQIEIILRITESSGKVTERLLAEFDAIQTVKEKKIDPIQHQVSYEKKELPLTEKEYQVFAYLTEQPNRVFMKEQIYQAVWKEEPVDVSSAVFCVIGNIRQKLRKVTKKEYIQTVWGVGYKFVDVPGE